ncbi:hypothetical protein Pla22_12790 [Rubripirellula amarantea]|uniref:Uncharacterized protein n=1 Tax=Rubripirellula amarantea TaxID=2527999 RepID=A0A5C5WTY0_9BACT|nr:hypothetical protein Pla22_12790 [Rubripirellula amarantea]
MHAIIVKNCPSWLVRLYGRREKLQSPIRVFGFAKFAQRIIAILAGNKTTPQLPRKLPIAITFELSLEINMLPALSKPDGLASPVIKPVRPVNPAISVR